MVIFACDAVVMMYAFHNSCASSFIQAESVYLYLLMFVYLYMSCGVVLVIITVVVIWYLKCSHDFKALSNKVDSLQKDNQALLKENEQLKRVCFANITLSHTISSVISLNAMSFLF